MISMTTSSPLKATSTKFKTIYHHFDLSLFLERSSKNRIRKKAKSSILMYSYFQDLFSCRILSCSLTTVDKNTKFVVYNTIEGIYVIFPSNYLCYSYLLLLFSFLNISFFSVSSFFQTSHFVAFFQSNISGNVSQF